MLLLLCNVDHRRGDNAEAEQLASQAIELARSNRIENLATRGLLQLGNAFFLRGQMAEAEKYFRQSLEFARRDKAPRSEARALFSLGSLKVQTDQPEEALPLVEQALQFFEAGGYRKESAQARTLIGRARRDKGDYPGALAAFEQQLAAATQVGDTAQVRLSHQGLGSIRLALGDFPRALEHSRQCEQISQNGGNRMDRAFDRQQEGRALWRLSRYEQAIAALEEARSIAAQPGGYRPLLRGIELERAQLDLSRRGFAGAIRSSKRVLAGGRYRRPGCPPRRRLSRRLPPGHPRPRRTGRPALPMAGGRLPRLRGAARYPGLSALARADPGCRIRGHVL